jgi:hypothetical protein
VGEDRALLGQGETVRVALRVVAVPVAVAPLALFGEHPLGLGAFALYMGIDLPAGHQSEPGLGTSPVIHDLLGLPAA